MQRTYQYILLVFFAFILMGCGQSKIDQIGEKVTAELQRNYGKAFVIVKDSGHYSYATDAYGFKVYPVDDPEYISGISTDGAGNIMFSTYDPNHQKQKAFVDQYIMSHISKVTTDFVVDSGAVEVAQDVSNKVFDIAVKNVRNAKTIKSLLDTDTTGLQVYANIDLNLEITPENVLNLLEQMYQVVEFLKPYHLATVDFRIMLYTLPEGVHINKKLYGEKAISHKDLVSEYNLVGAFNIRDWSNRPNAQQMGWVDDESLRNVHSPLDMAKYVTLNDFSDPKNPDVFTLPETQPLWSQVKALYAQQHDH